MEIKIKQWISKGYAQEVAQLIKSEDKAEDLDLQVLQLEIEHMAFDNIKYQELNEAEPTLSEKQIGRAIDSAAKAQLQNTISEMVDAGLLEAELDPNGEVVYKTTAKGCAYDDMIKDGFMTEEDFNKQFKEGKL